MKFHDRLKCAVNIGANIQKWTVDNGLAIKDVKNVLLTPAERYDEIISDIDLRKATRDLYISCHYAQSVEQACKYLDNLVSTKSGISDSGQSLMHAALNEKNPILQINQLRSQTDRDEQMGYRFLCAGCMTGVRNPRAHDHALADDPQDALEMLVIANHLIKKIKFARKSRKKINL
jgi:uncharacterized protein (TIGR02391 family)